jgi:1-acyl-sn-glycerol-3-phosphate acyltransferase
MRSSELTHRGPAVGRLAWWLSRLYLKVTGWDVEGEVPECTQAVFIAAPHTSNWDMPNMIACAFAFRLKPSWAGKRALFRWPWGWFMRWMGGVSVDRRGNRNTVQLIADLFDQHDKLYLGVAPAGTRSHTEYWKSGFYHIAREAGVPIVCAFLDYKRKIGGIGPAILPTGDIKADMDRVREFYGDIQGKRPEFKSLIRLRDETGVEPAVAVADAQG